VVDEFDTQIPRAVILRDFSSEGSCAQRPNCCCPGYSLHADASQAQHDALVEAREPTMSDAVGRAAALVRLQSPVLYSLTYLQ
jgi:hypothetical protein